MDDNWIDRKIVIKQVENGFIVKYVAATSGGRACAKMTKVVTSIDALSAFIRGYFAVADCKHPNMKNVTTHMGGSEYSVERSCPDCGFREIDDG